VLLTSTEPTQQFSAPFKAVNSRQVQTCYKPQKYNTKETATFSSLHRYRRNVSSHDLETPSIDIMPLAACMHKHFHFWCSTSYGILSQLSETLPLSQNKHCHQEKKVFATLVQTALVQKRQKCSYLYTEFHLFVVHPMKNEVFVLSGTRRRTGSHRRNERNVADRVDRGRQVEMQS